MTASLERYLKDALQEYVDLIASHAKLTSNARLPSEFVANNDLNFLNWLIRDSRLEKLAKVIELKRVAKLIAGDAFVSESFNRTRSNPGQMTITELLKCIGIKDPFAVIEVNFKRHYKLPFPAKFVENTIHTIVSKRNEIAHGGFALSISRQEIHNWNQFLIAFARAADNTLRDHALSLIATL